MPISCHEWMVYVILRRMEMIRAHLRLSTNLNGSTRERCPDVVFTRHGEEVAVLRTDVEQPQLPFDQSSVAELIIHDDALSRSIDEEVWLAEFARVLKSGGRLRLTLPAAGALAWLDTMNAYRYIADISGRGHAPDAANPTGWNRHYTREHITRLLTGAGFSNPSLHRQNNALRELGFLGGMLLNNWIREDRRSELRLFPQFGHRDPGDRARFITTTWSITATKQS